MKKQNSMGGVMPKTVKNASKQFYDPIGPQKTPTTMGQDKSAARQDMTQARGMGIRKGMQVNGAMVSKSPTLTVEGDAYRSSRNMTAVESGAAPRASKFPIGTSAPQDARTLSRAPAGWLK